MLILKAREQSLSPAGEMNKSIIASVCLFGDEGESFH